RISLKKEVMQMDVVETIMDAGFDPAIRRNMDDDVHEIVEKAIDGDQAAQVRYLERFLEVVKGIDEDLHQVLLRKVTLHGPDKGVKEFLNETAEKVVLFEIEVIDMLRDHIRQGLPTMEELVDVELEDLGFEENPEAQDLVFRFWAPGEGIEPLAEITCKDPEARPNFVRD